MPNIYENPKESVELSGFLHLIILFKPFDDAFVGLWNQSVQGTNPDWIVDLQKQLAEALPRYLSSTETQAVDLKTSQHWLQVMIWQLSISHRLLSSAASDASLTFQYPVELSRRLLAETSTFPQQSMEVHGIGYVKKLFDVACTLVDVMACVPIDQPTFGLGPRDYLDQFLRLLSQLRGGQERYLPLLLSKAVDSIPDQVSALKVPRMLPIPITRILPTTSGTPAVQVSRRSEGEGAERSPVKHLDHEDRYSSSISDPLLPDSGDKARQQDFTGLLPESM